MSRLTRLFMALSLFVGSGFCQTAQDEMQAGVKAYRSAKDQEAIRHFQRAVALDPDLTAAHLYLGNCYAQQYIPGSDSEEAIAIGENAITELKLVLSANTPQDERIAALRLLGSVQFNMKKFEPAKNTYSQLSSLVPEDTNAYYTIGVIDWTECYTPRMDLRASMNLKPTDEITTVSACNLLRSMNQKNVEDGIEKLSRALDLKPDYDDAMAYMNLLYREKAEYECDNPEQRQTDLKMADQWVDRALQSKKAKAEKETQAAPQ